MLGTIHRGRHSPWIVMRQADSAANQPRPRRVPDAKTFLGKEWGDQGVVPVIFLEVALTRDAPVSIRRPRLRDNVQDIPDVPLTLVGWHDRETANSGP